MREQDSVVKPKLCSVSETLGVLDPRHSCSLAQEVFVVIKLDIRQEKLKFRDCSKLIQSLGEPRKFCDPGRNFRRRIRIPMDSSHVSGAKKDTTP